MRPHCHVEKCGILVIESAEMASENHTWASTCAYDYPRAFLTCQMALEILEISIKMHVDVPAHVFTLVACEATTLTLLSISQLSLTCPNCIKDTKYMLSLKIS